MRETRPSGSEGGVESHISIPTPIYRKAPCADLLFFSGTAARRFAPRSRAAEKQPVFIRVYPCLSVV